MSAKAFIRILDGKMATFRGFQASDDVVISIEGYDRVLKKTEWESLPVLTSALEYGASRLGIGSGLHQTWSVPLGRMSPPKSP